MTRQRRGDYRIFVGAFPQGDLAARIQEMRAHYDPETAQIAPPHVTLAGTYWRSGRATVTNERALIEQLKTRQSSICSFELVLGGIRRFGNRAVYLGVRPTPALLAARAGLLAVIGRDKHRRYTPHLTLAMRLNPAAMDAMVTTLQQTRWETERWRVPVTRLQLMLRGPSDSSWHAIATLRLEPC